MENARISAKAERTRTNNQILIKEGILSTDYTTNESIEKIRHIIEHGAEQIHENQEIIMALINDHPESAQLLYKTYLTGINDVYNDLKSGTKGPVIANPEKFLFPKGVPTFEHFQQIAAQDLKEVTDPFEMRKIGDHLYQKINNLYKLENGTNERREFNTIQRTLNENTQKLPEVPFNRLESIRFAAIYLTQQKGLIHSDLENIANANIKNGSYQIINSATKEILNSIPINNYIIQAANLLLKDPSGEFIINGVNNIDNFGELPPPEGLAPNPLLSKEEFTDHDYEEIEKREGEPGDKGVITRKLADNTTAIIKSNVVEFSDGSSVRIRGERVIYKPPTGGEDTPELKITIIKRAIENAGNKQYKNVLSIELLKQATLKEVPAINEILKATSSPQIKFIRINQTMEIALKMTINTKYEESTHLRRLLEKHPEETPTPEELVNAYLLDNKENILLLTSEKTQENFNQDQIDEINRLLIKTNLKLTINHENMIGPQLNASPLSIYAELPLMIDGKNTEIKINISYNGEETNPIIYFRYGNEGADSTGGKNILYYQNNPTELTEAYNQAQEERNNETFKTINRG